MRPLSASLKRSLESETLEHEKNLEIALPYLQARGIDHDTARRFRLGVVNDSTSDYDGRLSIPSLGFDSGTAEGHVGNLVYNLRFRALDDSKPKYLGLPHFEVRLFNVRAIHEAGEEVHITEGELDSIILEGVGLRSVGVCGANSWKRHHPRMFGGFTRVYVWGDGDEAGRSFAAKVADSLLTVKKCKLGTGQDVTDLFLEQGEDGIRKAMGDDG